MNELLKYSTKPEVRNDRARNALNGSDAESLGASLLVQATRGEIRWGSREEDNKKTDLLLSVDHPWMEKVRLTINVQVKSGDANGVRHDGGFRLKSSVVKQLKQQASRTCALWIDRNDGGCFWAYIHPYTSDSTHDYGEIHMLSPATLFDLARCNTRFEAGFIEGGSGITISSAKLSVAKLRLKARKSYQQTGPVINPVLGPIEITRVGWRHMFRSSRKNSGKESSLRTIPHLKNVLSRVPSEHFIPEYNLETVGDSIIRSAIHILKYKNAKRLEKDNKTVPAEIVIKVQEDIRYPVNWRELATLSQQIERRVVLISAYHKDN